MYNCFCKNTFSFFWDKFPGVQLLGQTAITCFILEVTAKLFSKVCCTILHWHQQIMNDPFSLNSHQHLHCHYIIYIYINIYYIYVTIYNNIYYIYINIYIYILNGNTECGHTCIVLCTFDPRSYQFSPLMSMLAVYFS